MTASLGRGQRDAHRRLAGGRRRVRICALGEEFYPHRFSANAAAEAPLTFVGFGIVSPERGHDDYRDAVARPHRAGSRSRAGRQRSGQPVRRRGHGRSRRRRSQEVLAAQEKGAVGVIFVEDVHNQPAPASNFQAQAANYWPATPPARRALHAQVAGRTTCAFPSCRCRCRSPSGSSRRPGGRSLTIWRGRRRRAAASRPFRSTPPCR